MLLRWVHITAGIVWAIVTIVLVLSRPSTMA
jgi:hypothetical protein